MLPIVIGLVIIPTDTNVISAIPALADHTAVITASAAMVPLVSSAMDSDPSSPQTEPPSKACALSAAEIIDGLSVQSDPITVSQNETPIWKPLHWIVLMIVFWIKDNILPIPF